MLWLEIARISVPGVVLGLVLGKLLSENPYYFNLLNPKLLIERIKRASKNKLLRIASLSVFFGGLIFLAGLGIGEIVVRLWGPLIASENIFSEIGNFSLPLLIISVIFLPILEEWIFRGIILEEISRISQSKWIGLVSSSLIFAAFHLSNPGTYLAAMIPYFIGGLLIGGSYLLGGLAVAVLCHIISNLIPFLL